MTYLAGSGVAYCFKGFIVVGPALVAGTSNISAFYYPLFAELPLSIAPRKGYFGNTFLTYYFTLA